MCLKGIKLVTFDVTNTLLKFKVPPWQYYTIVAKNHGFNGNPDDIKKRLVDNMKVMSKEHPNYGRKSISWEKWWTELVKMTFRGHLPITANVDIIADQIINDYKSSKCWYIADGTLEIIEYLKKKNIPIGVISNFDPRLYSILHDISLHNSFDFIVTSYEIGYTKPDKRIFATAINMINENIKPNEALHIGDDVEKDYEGARAAGWHAILVNPNMNSMTPPDPQHVFNSLQDLYKILEQDKLTL